MRNATSALSGGVSRKLPPSASSGANAIACSTPSTRPQRSRSVVGERGQVVGAVDVELQDVGRPVELGRRALGHAPDATERGQHDLGPRGLRLAGDLVRDRLAVDDAGDDQLLAFEQRHRGMFLTPVAGSAIASSVDRASASRRRVSPGRMTSSMWPSAAARWAPRWLSAYSAAYASRAATGSSAAAMLAPVDDRDRLLGAHHAELGLRPRERVVGAEVARVHGDERAAEGLAQHDRQPSAPWPRRTRARAWRRGGSRRAAPGLVPGMKPGVSTSTTSGSPKRSQVRTKRAPFCDDSASSTPPR